MRRLLTHVPQARRQDLGILSPQAFSSKSVLPGEVQHIDSVACRWRPCGVEPVTAVVRRAAPAIRAGWRAAIAGRVVDLSDELRPGAWVAANERLLTVMQPDRALIEAYVSEADLARIAIGTPAVFHPEQDWGEPTNAHVVRIERAKSGEWVPESAVYRVTLEPDGALAAPARVVRGHAALSGARESLAARAWRQVVAVAVRESGL